MKKIFLIPCLIYMAAASSCSDFLNVEPTTAADAGAAITTAADAKVIVNGLMSKLASASYYGRNFPLYADAKGGDVTITSQGRGYDYLYVFNHSESANSYSSIWSQGYHCLAQINNLIESIEKLKAAGSSENFDNHLGQALTARAMIYFDLVRLYGEPYAENKNAFGVPNVTTLLNSDAQELRHTVEENYQQITTDLKAAEDLLSKTKANGFINYYANKALQARVYLYMEDFTQSLAAAEEVINSNVYTLYENDKWAESWTTEFGTESILELGVYPNEGDLGNSSLGAMYRRAAHGSSAILGYFTASTNFLDKLAEDEEDVRWSVMAPDELSETSTHPGERLGSSYKYSGSTVLAGDKKTGNSTAVNIKVIRLSEIYLIAAEAALKLSSSDKEKAAHYLNAIRKRSPNLALATPATINMDMIADERSKELFTEGHRFFDMMRWNRSITFDDDLGAISTIHREKTIDRTFYKTILPIPLDEINANPGIKAQQNPGY
ncbi:RagB/SusD domain-containing protein [Sphingobacterium allocomposti]|uniref:RagB/SusD domain-containing protein n=1 Tax=Sphingobacterium allocomposti TaxID=415956 RepID=A0A5S5DPR3_9SPHI|nr:RagB/SusD family nutrient uptake outer membrane protein [Sphingobacterium composti Yoo et al. 2007 non Ten et al. 2007]TYP96679.1 RagB/SusD domain-containing protein [Sphingobacterium composti Yoo et al. 2007 non Ten et al. 2007]